MDDWPEIALKTVCCTCLCKGRKLFQLCRITDGVNDLYWLLSHDSEAYKEGFYKDTANLFICWECRAILWKLTRFREQACAAQRHLTSIADGRTDTQVLSTCFSRLSQCHKTSYDQSIVSEVALEGLTDNFIDCGPIADAIKSEDDDFEDVPLSELHNKSNYISDSNEVFTDSEINKNYTEPHLSNVNNTGILPHPKKYLKSRKEDKRRLFKKKKKTKIKTFLVEKSENYYTSVVMSEEEMYESREKRKLAVIYSDAVLKCESCLEGFKNQLDLDKHNSAVHEEKDKHTQCGVCLAYVKTSSLSDHQKAHYVRYSCQFCDHASYSLADMLKHLKGGHAMQNIVVPVKRKKGQSKTSRATKQPGSKPRRNQAMMDKRTPFGYLCSECNKYFDNKNQRWKHVQQYHREGFKCQTCGKRFAFKNNLSRHEQVHQGPPPREECATCHKMIRTNLLKVHARIHAPRERFSCAECEKQFVSRASYEHHLKYTQAHAATDILKYKCSMCDKGYRSRGELRDHVNYQHVGKTPHKCPVCGKALATRRCITRHVRRAHDGVKESARDKICQQCGKAFRDKKGLREHEFIHTGERPLSCEICGCTFRQSASLYTHKRRVHKICQPRRRVELLEPGDVGAASDASAQRTDR